MTSIIGFLHSIGMLTGMSTGDCIAGQTVASLQQLPGPSKGINIVVLRSSHNTLIQGTSWPSHMMRELRTLYNTAIGKRLASIMLIYQTGGSTRS